MCCAVVMGVEGLVCWRVGGTGSSDRNNIIYFHVKMEELFVET